MHKELAENYGGQGKWGYSKSSGVAFTEGNEQSAGRGEQWLRQGGSRAEVAGRYEFGGETGGPAWLRRREGERTDALGEDGTVAQV